MFANKNKAYKFTPQSLKILVSSLMGENGKILPAVFEKFIRKCPPFWREHLAREPKQTIPKKFGNVSDMLMVNYCIKHSQIVNDLY